LRQVSQSQFIDG